MTRRFEGEKLVLATHNKGKAKEIAALFAGRGVAFITAGELSLLEPEETETTFIGNAVLKARAAAIASGLPCLADDRGFCVNALNGDPGVYSARWAGPEKDFGMAMEKVQAALGDTTDKSCYFICVLALAWPDGHVETVEGRVEGQAIWPPRGDHGFGYDPMFVADGHDKSFAEITAEEEQAVSHRAPAFKAMMDKCF